VRANIYRIIVTQPEFEESNQLLVGRRGNFIHSIRHPEELIMRRENLIWCHQRHPERCFTAWGSHPTPTSSWAVLYRVRISSFIIF